MVEHGEHLPNVIHRVHPASGGVVTWMTGRLAVDTEVSTRKPKLTAAILMPAFYVWDFFSLLLLLCGEIPNGKRM